MIQNKTRVFFQHFLLFLDVMVLNDILEQAAVDRPLSSHARERGLFLLFLLIFPLSLFYYFFLLNILFDFSFLLLDASSKYSKKQQIIFFLFLSGMTFRMSQIYILFFLPFLPGMQILYFGWCQVCFDAF